jgi:ABC-type branched-subunit amino acid transport system substrate-binding protein
MFRKKLLLLFFLFLICCKGTKPPVASDGTFQPYDSIELGDLIDNQSSRKMRVALLFPITGRAERMGEIMLHSAILAMFNNNLNNIMLMVYDTRGTDLGAIDAVNSAIREGVDIIVGPFSTQETEAIVDIANSNEIIVLSLSDNTNLLNKGRSNLYLMGLTPKQEVDRIISYLIDKRNFYGFSAMFPSSIYGSSVSTIFTDVIRRKDAKIIKRDFYSTNDSRLFQKTTELLNSVGYRDEVYQKYEEEKAIAKAEKIDIRVEFKYTDEDKIVADAILLPDSGSDLNKIGFYYANHISTKKPILIGTSKWLNNNLYNNDDFTGGIFVSPNPVAYNDFQNNYHEIYNSYPIRVASYVYDAIVAIIESYAKAQYIDNFRYALENYQGFEGVNGRFRFLSTGLLERKLNIMRIRKGKYEIIDYDNEPFLKY